MEKYLEIGNLHQYGFNIKLSNLTIFFHKEFLNMILKEHKIYGFLNPVTIQEVLESNFLMI